MTRMHSLIALFLPIFALLFTSCSANVSILSPEEASKRLATGAAVLVDVREPNEWSETGVPGPAHLLPLSDLKGNRSAWKAFLDSNKDKELLLLCRSGNRSGQAASLLAKEGYRTANAGAFSAWKKAGLPTRQPNESRQ